MASSQKTKLTLKEWKARHQDLATKRAHEDRLLFGSHDDAKEEATTIGTDDVTSGHASHESPSNNLKAAAFLPTTPTADLPTIHRTPSGIIDTIIADLDAPVSKRDVARLRARDEWTVTERGAGKKQKPGEEVRELNAFLSLWRASDGCRVHCFKDRTRVEVSLPRVLGYTNDKQSWMSEDDQLEAFASVTTKLLPMTTARAGWERHALWHLERIDLAKNFLGCGPEIIESLRLAKHPCIRSSATVSGQDGLALYGTNVEFCLYDMDAKIGRGKVSKSVRGKAAAKAATRDLQGLSRLRFEFRYLTDVGLDRFTKRLSPSAKGLPFMVKREDGTRQVVRLGFTNHLLHQILANEARALGTVTATQADGAKNWKGIGLLGRLYLVEHPEAWSYMKTSYGERSLRGFAQDVAALKLSRRDDDLVSMIWHAPQITPQLRALLVDQQDGMSARRRVS